MPDPPLGDELRARREARGLSQGEVAEHIGVSAAALAGERTSERERNKAMHLPTSPLADGIDATALTGPRRVLRRLCGGERMR